jgi:DUF438 domain-containing protein
MGKILDFLGNDHKECDHLFAEVEVSVSKKDWNTAEKQLNDFLDRMRRHFAMEEELFFPEFEAKTGMTQGPTAIMRMEHDTMRAIFAKMIAALESKNANSLLGESEGLLFIMQQHNSKEEQMLYPMGDQVFGAAAAQLVDSLKKIN